MAMTPDADPDALELAKLAIRFRRPIGGAIHLNGKLMAQHAQRYLERVGVRYWISKTATHLCQMRDDEP